MNAQNYDCNYNDYLLPGDNINCDFRGNKMSHITQLEIQGDLLQLIHEGLWAMGYSFTSENALNRFLLRMGAISFGESMVCVCFTIGRRFEKKVVVEIGVGTELSYEGNKAILKTFLFPQPRPKQD